MEIFAPLGRRQLSARVLGAVGLRAIDPEGKLPIRGRQPVPNRPFPLAFVWAMKFARG